MKKKIIFILVFIALFGALKFLTQHEIDRKAIEEHLNSIYDNYAKNPDNYVTTKGKIIKEYDEDDGLEINFYGTNSWLIEVTLPDDTKIETCVLRDENDNIGDIIDIAYLNDDNKSLTKYMNATQLHYIELYGEYESIDILKTCINVAMVGMVAFTVFMFIKKRIN